VPSRPVEQQKDGSAVKSPTPAAGRMNATAFVPMFRKIWLMLDRRERRRALLQLLLTIMGMFLEMLGIGIVIPAVMLMTQDDLGAKYPVVQPYLEMLGNPTKVQLIVGGMLTLVSVYLVKSVFLAFVAWRQNRFAFRVRVRLSEQLLTTYLRQPYTFHLMRNSAMLVRNAQFETQQFVMGGLRPCMVFISESLLILGVSIVLILIEPVGALMVVAVLGGATLPFQYFTRRRIVRWGEARRHNDGMRIKHMQQALGSVKDIKLMGREREFLARYAEHNRRAANAAEKQTTLAQLPKLWLELLAVSGLALLVTTMVLQGQDMVSILPTLAVFGAAAFRMLPSVNRLVNSVQSMRFSSTVIDSLYGELQLPAPELVARGVAQASEFRNEIRVTNVGFAYAGANHPALSNLSFSVSKGESIGLIGPSGSGKSTAIDVFLGLLTPASGSVSVDGVDIYEDLRRWQNQIGYVPQAIYLADESLLRNVAFGIASEHIDADAVDRAIRAAQLEEFVAELPHGLDTVVGERGVRLSGGQRQRIGIARALYHDPVVLVLDEATSALDSATERGVMEAVEALHGSKTILIVAHRLSTVENCDRILQLHEGRLVAEGPPGTLLASQAGLESPIDESAGAR
jgi:ATP-binding cassette, subfamily B, bacterial PglK